MEKTWLISYDPIGDVLYLSFGKVEAGIAEETDAGILRLKHPETGESIGITILDFQQRFKVNPQTQLPISLASGIPSEALLSLSNA